MLVQYVFAYFRHLLSSLVVPAASAEDSSCVPPSGAVPLLGTLPSGTSAKGCCQDVRPSGVRVRTCLVSCSPEGYEKLYFIGRWLRQHQFREGTSN